jgi:hypothetical protein
MQRRKHALGAAMLNKKIVDKGNAHAREVRRMDNELWTTSM